jgi:hypothetical protein
LTLASENPQRGSEILNALITEYRNQNIDEKNIVATNTVNFITNRLQIVKNELDGVEDKATMFKKANPYFYQKELFLGKTQEFDINTKMFIELSGKLDAVTQLQKRIIETNKVDLVPSYLGIDDPTIAALVGFFNTEKAVLINEEKALGRNSELIARAKLNLDEARNSLIKRLGDYKVDLEKKRKQLEENNANLKSLFSGGAEFEKTAKSVGREQNIKEAIYIYLMQRREETLVTSAATTSNYQQYDEVTIPAGPFEPDQAKWRLYGIIIGLLFPIGLIYVKAVLNDKVTSRDDITKKTSAPFIGEVGHYSNTKAFVVAHKSRSIISEQFRIIRTNLQFLLTEGKKTVLVTSSISGEGKSFITLNLGAVLAISGKKVAVLEFDLRKPRIIKSIGVEKKELGISNFLIGQSKTLDNLYYTFEQYPTLNAYGCGPIPPNTSELMLGVYMKDFFFQCIKALYLRGLVQQKVFYFFCQLRQKQTFLLALKALVTPTLYTLLLKPQYRTSS